MAVCHWWNRITGATGHGEPCEETDLIRFVSYVARLDPHTVYLIVPLKESNPTAAK